MSRDINCKEVGVFEISNLYMIKTRHTFSLSADWISSTSLNT